MKTLKLKWMALVVTLLGAGCQPAAQDAEGAAAPGGDVVTSAGAEEAPERADEELAIAPTPEVEGPAGQLAARVFEAHGGQRWPQVEELGFRFVVLNEGEEVFAATHDWKVWEGMDRVRWTDAEGGEWDVTVDLNNGEADEAMLDDEALEGEDLEAAGAEAYKRWVNDVYWLLMPIKLFDPGVNLAHAGEVESNEGTVEALELSFEEVGLTPGDRYVVHVDPQSHEVRAWEMHLQGDRPASLVYWDDYQELGPLRLPLKRTWEGGERQIIFDTLHVK